MFPGTPSLTAMYVALARSVATHEAALSLACRDPVAHRLLPRSLRMLARMAALSPTTARALRYSQLGMFDHHAMRTALIDQALHAALERGAEQLVLLGAGLDTRGHRMPALSNTVVFELDHAHTQDYKRVRVGSLAHGAREIRYASCDFEQAGVAQALRGVGFDAMRPSCVIWEGVTMYLQESAVERMLSLLSQLCAPRSTLIATYLLRSTRAPSMRNWSVTRGLLRVVAEPLRFDASVAGMAERLRRHSFDTLGDVLPLAEARSFGVPPLPFPSASAAVRERVVAAQRRARRG